MSEGRITLDGVDVRDLSLDALRGAIGIVPQDPVLFSGTIRENIAYARPGASEDDIDACGPRGARAGVHRAPAQRLGHARR